MSPRAAAQCRGPSGELASSFLVLLSPVHPFTGMGGGELYHAFLDGLAIALSELQTGNPNDALASLVGSKHGVCWGPSSYSHTDSYS
jgi:hypothetical protein